MSNKRKLGHFIKLQGGYAFKSSDFSEQGVPIVRISNIRNNKLDFSDAAFYDNQIKNNLSDYLIEEDDVLIAMSGATTGKVGIASKDNLPAIVNQRVGRFVIQDKEKLSKKFLRYLVQSSDFINQVNVHAIGGAQPNISATQIESISLYIPEMIKEQQKIASILSSVDAAIEKTEQVIAKTEEVKKGLMQQLLTKGIGHTEFKQTEIGEIPVEWEVVKFNDICKNITDKFDPKIEEVKTYIALEHIEQTTGKLLGTDISTSSTSLKTQFKKDDVLFGKLRPYLRKYVYADFEGVCATEILVLRSKDICYSKYLFLLVQEENFLEFIASRTFGTKMPRTSWNEIKEYSIPLPQLQEQYEVVKIVGNLSKKLESESIKLDKLKDIKSGLMQQLLTGKVRVKID